MQLVYQDRFGEKHIYSQTQCEKFKEENGLKLIGRMQGDTFIPVEKVRRTQNPNHQDSVDIERMQCQGLLSKWGFQ